MNLQHVHARAGLNRSIRRFFEERDFLEVETALLVDAAGTDPHLDPLPATLRIAPQAAPKPMALHTSPEFAMKELLVEGLERIYQLCHVWRDGEVTSQHNPEFTILEWYRRGADYQAIMDDVEALVVVALGTECGIEIDGYRGAVDLSQPFQRITMRDAWLAACGIDPIATAGDVAGLAEASGNHRWDRWDELFFDLMLERVEPWLVAQGAVFITEWPTELAVLARKCSHDERVAERFELYLGGVEIANGFGELTDPVEQRRRFVEDNVTRRELGKLAQPLPERFLGALERGLPDCAGVALGVDRLLMLQVGASSIADVLPFAVTTR